MPPTDSHVAREFAALKGAALRFSFCEKKQKGHFGIAFLFPKSFQQGRFYVLFASAKRTKKQPGLTPCDLGSKLCTGMFLIEFVAFSV